MKIFTIVISFISLFLFSCGSNPAETLDEKEWISKDGNLLIFSGDSCFTSFTGRFTKVHGDTILNDSILIMGKRNARSLKFKISGDSLLLTENDSIWKFTYSFYKLNSITSIPSSFGKLSHYSHGCSTSRDECRQNSIEIDSLGNFHYWEIIHDWSTGSLVDTINNEGLIPSRFMNVLNKLLGKCELKKYHQDSTFQCDGLIEAFSIILSNGNRFTDFKNEYLLPDELHSTYNYLRCLSHLIDVGYFETKKDLKPHCFDAVLTSCCRQEDSMRYMQQFDSVNYHLPEYPGGEDSMRTIVYQNIHRELAKDTNRTYYFYVEYTVKEDGSIHVFDTGGKYCPIDKKTDALISKDLLQAFSKLDHFRPGMYNGKIIPVRLYLDVDYHSK